MTLAESTPQEPRVEVREEILARLRRAEGQLRGIQKMIEDERACHDVLIQLAAVKAAVVQAAMTILSTELAQCVQEGSASGRMDRAALDKFMEVFKKFS